MPSCHALRCDPAGHALESAGIVRHERVALIENKGRSFNMNKKIRLVVPEAPSPQAVAATETRAVAKGGIRLGVLDNSKGNADHLLRFIVDGVKALLPVASVVMTRKDSVSLPAPAAILDQLAAESDYVITAMAD
jgi:hypothetical protein